MNTRARQVLVSIFAVVVWGLLNAHKAHTQAVFGTFLGTVQDQQGAVVPNAPVAATNLETGVVRSTITDRSGSYRIANVPPGSYQLACWLPDWREQGRELDADSWQVTRLTFRPSVELAQPVTLEPGATHHLSFTLSAASFSQ